MSALVLTNMRPLVEAALREDLGLAGDITSRALIPETQRARAVLAARQAGVVAGLPCFEDAFRQLDPAVHIHLHAADGQVVEPGTRLAVVEGSARAVLSAERVALNFVGRLSGIATLTHAYARAVAATRAKVTDTRKTTPGLRLLEKYAVRCGGGVNHRFGLFDAMLIKDNHIALAGGVTAALERAHASAHHLCTIEIEVDTLNQLAEALEAGARHILLDNMTPAQLHDAVAMNKGRAVLEASGSVTLSTIKTIADTGVDFISCGALTHSAPNFDVALDVEI